ncbi:MAG: Uma2 family endonuclease [Cyanobacteria bacterium P01_F01_bin.150]
MVQISDRPAKLSISFEQYVSGQFECPWSDCIWVDGEIVQVAPESGQNNNIAIFLTLEFGFYSRSQGIGLGICHKDTDIEVNSIKHRTRKPDVMVCSAKLKAELKDRSSVILKSMDPPLLIVEVISKNYRNVDLEEKAREYCDRAVPEYWTVDWDRPDPLIIVRDFNPQTKQYIERTYRPGDTVVSKVLPELVLTVDEILKADNV